MLCRCIRILAHVSGVEYYYSCSIVSQIVAAWSPGVTWFSTSDDSNNVIYHTIQLGSSMVSNEISTQTGLYFAMENVSSNGAICNLPFIIGDLEYECYIQDI